MNKALLILFGPIVALLCLMLIAGVLVAWGVAMKYGF